MMPYFSLKSLEFMNEILRYNATIQINPFGRIFVRYYSVSKNLPLKNLKVCGNFCFAGELLYHG